MVRLTRHDESNLLIFAEGHLPPLSALKALYPGSGRYREDAHWMPSEDSEVVPWILASYAQRIAVHRGFDQQIASLMEAWVIAPPAQSEARLAPWFENMPDDYRVMVYRSPMLNSDPFGAPLSWDHVHERLPLKSRHGPYAALKSIATAFLDEMLETYRGDHSDRVAVMQSLGQPYDHSSGLAYQAEGS